MGMWRSKPMACSRFPQRSGGDCTWTNPARRSRSPSATTACSSPVYRSRYQPISAGFGPNAGNSARREVDDHVAAHRVTVHEDGHALLEHLDQLDADEP